MLSKLEFAVEKIVYQKTLSVIYDIILRLVYTFSCSRDCSLCLILSWKSCCDTLAITVYLRRQSMRRSDTYMYMYVPF